VPFHTPPRLARTAPHRPPFEPINSRSRLNNKNLAMVPPFSVTGADVDINPSLFCLTPTLSHPI